MWEALATKAATGLVGGAVSSLFGGGGDSRPKSSDYIRANKWEARARQGALRDDLVHLVAGAQKAGFNPLTVLGATGGSLGGGGAAQSIAAGGQYGQPLSVGASAAQAAGQAIANYDPILEERRRLENDLLETQIETTKEQNERFGLQGVRTTTSPTTGSLDPVTAFEADTRYQDQQGEPIRADPSSSRVGETRIRRGDFAGQYIYRDPVSAKVYALPKSFTPSETWEAQLGQLIGEGYGFVAAAKDLLGPGVQEVEWRNKEWRRAMGRTSGQPLTGSPLPPQRIKAPSVADPIPNEWLSPNLRSN
ncbi:hypothetical protein [Microviridae sp.]|nr:hypothetical protein [Microviridae sp.]